MESINDTAEKGANKGKGKDRGKPKGENDTKGVGKSAKGKRGSTVAQNEEAKSEYTSYTAQEKNWAHRNSKKNGRRSAGKMDRDGNGVHMNTGMYG